jgi:hypothetical protein
MTGFRISAVIQPDFTKEVKAMDSGKSWYRVKLDVDYRLLLALGALILILKFVL